MEHRLANREDDRVVVLEAPSRIGDQAEAALSVRGPQQRDVQFWVKAAGKTFPETAHRDLVALWHGMGNYVVHANRPVVGVQQERRRPVRLGG